MCDVAISWVGISASNLLVLLEVSDDCTGVKVRLWENLPGGGTGRVIEQFAQRDPEHGWYARLDLGLVEADRFVCGPRLAEGDPGPLPYGITATCVDDPACRSGYARELRCCPRVTLGTWHWADDCEDPDLSNLMRRRLTVSWCVRREAVADDIRTRLVVTWDGGSASGDIQAQVLEFAGPATGDQETWFEDSVLVPGGVFVQMRIELISPPPCGDEDRQDLQRRLMGASCETCTGVSKSTGPFVVTDDDGTVLTDQVSAEQCVDADRVTVDAPADIPRNGRFRWLPPAQPTAEDPFKTKIDVPDTDEGIRVECEFGSSPCSDQRHVVIRRCQKRPLFCQVWKFDCWVVHAVGAIALVVCLVALYTGLVLVVGGTVKVAGATTVSTVGQGVQSGGSAIPEPVTNAIVTLTGTTITSYAQISAIIATWTGIIGIFIVEFGCIAFLIWLVCLQYWWTCCAPRDWACTLVRTLSWCIQWFAIVQPLVALVVAIVFGLLHAVLNVDLLFGVAAGLGAVFAIGIGVVLTIVVSVVAIVLGCRAIWPFELPWIE